MANCPAAVRDRPPSILADPRIAFWALAVMFVEPVMLALADMTTCADAVMVAPAVSEALAVVSPSFWPEAVMLIAPVRDAAADLVASAEARTVALAVRDAADGFANCPVAIMAAPAVSDAAADFVASGVAVTIAEPVILALAEMTTCAVAVMVADAVSEALAVVSPRIWADPVMLIAPVRDAAADLVASAEARIVALAVRDAADGFAN